MIKAVVFDLDDTLYPEHEYVSSGFKSVAKYIQKKINMDTGSIYQMLLQLHKDFPKQVFNKLIDLNDEMKSFSVNELIEIYRTHDPSIELYKDAQIIIGNIKSQHIKLGIITDGYFEAQKRKICALNLSNKFDEIILTDQLGREYWKPHTYSFEIMKKKLDVEFDEILYVGDNPNKDFFIGSIYPIITVKINRNSYYQNMEYYFNIKEMYTIDSLLELTEIISEINDLKDI